MFRLQPERAHYLTVALLRFALRLPFGKSIFKGLYTDTRPNLQRQVAGLNFPNAVGLAAGFDKNGEYIAEMSALGFGFIEVGTVTPLAQDGNPQPRLFRLPKDKALINRMGFNNKGMDELVNNLKAYRQKYPDAKVIIGGNIGKNKVTPNENADSDYEKCFIALFDHVDYFVVNVSSPNTPDLRALQDKEPLQKLLSHLQGLNLQKPNPKPIFLKIAPDLNDSQLDDIIDIVKSTHIAGLIATNTTISREGLLTDKAELEQIGAGGLSGAPVRERSTAVIAYLAKNSQGAFPIIAVGGIATAADAQEKLAAGASLVQVYSGLVYEGPGMIKRILNTL